MRNVPLKAFASPLKNDKKAKTNDYSNTRDFSKTQDYSPKATKGNFGDRLAKAVTPDNTPQGLFTSAVPVGKAIKLGKTIYNYMTS